MDKVLLECGDGGLLSAQLIDFIVGVLGDVYLGEMNDSFATDEIQGKIAITTDSFTVDPLFFKNGDIGKISVCGTVNDLAVSGATPLYLTLAMVIEEGFLMKDLERILNSIKEACIQSGVKIVAGDTKVMRRGEVDKILINTTGVGIFNNKARKLSDIQEGDKIIITGPVGNHGVHILSMRAGLGFESKVLSDCASLNRDIEKVICKHSDSIKYMRDLTRGGVGSIFNEIAVSIDKNIAIENLNIQHETEMACKMLGINPLYLANEGNICVFCSADDCENILNTMRQLTQYFTQARVVGEVIKKNDTNSVVIMKNTGKVLPYLEGAELPRLC